MLPTTVGFASYSFAAGSVTNNSGTSGTVYNTSNLQVNFDLAGAGPVIMATINTSFGNVVDNYVYFSSSSFTSTSGAIKGIFTGPNANRAGLVFNGSLSPLPGTFSGAAVFEAP